MSAIIRISMAMKISVAVQDLGPAVAAATDCTLFWLPVMDDDLCRLRVGVRVMLGLRLEVEVLLNLSLLEEALSPVFGSERS
ncbi:hypothetical protein ACOMHN_051893 [Nucella lapillus]